MVHRLLALRAGPKQDICPVFGSFTAWSHPISTPGRSIQDGDDALMVVSDGDEN